MLVVCTATLLFPQSSAAPAAALGALLLALLLDNPPAVGATRKELLLHPGAGTAVAADGGIVAKLPVTLMTDRGEVRGAM